MAAAPYTLIGKDLRHKPTLQVQKNVKLIHSKIYRPLVCLYKISIDYLLKETQERGSSGSIWEGNLGSPEIPADRTLPSKLEVLLGQRWEGERKTSLYAFA